jgi:hypothetical protein
LVNANVGETASGESFVWWVHNAWRALRYLYVYWPKYCIRCFEQFQFQFLNPAASCLLFLNFFSFWKKNLVFWHSVWGFWERWIQVKDEVLELQDWFGSVLYLSTFHKNNWLLCWMYIQIYKWLMI